MKNLKIPTLLRILILTLGLSSFLMSAAKVSPPKLKDFIYSGVKNKKSCLKKTGYWYKKKCWKDYKEEDGEIPKSQVDGIVDEAMSLLKKSFVTFDKKKYPLEVLIGIPNESGFRVSVIYKDENQKINNGERALSFTLPFKLEEELTIPVKWQNSHVLSSDSKTLEMAGMATAKPLSENDYVIEVSGTLTNVDGKGLKQFSFTVSDKLAGLGDSQIKVRGKSAYLTGNALGAKTYYQVRALIKNHPEVKTLVFSGHIRGSLNDDVNTHTGRLIHENKLDTKVLSDTTISSGAVDLFSAGIRRIAEEGAKIGVHSWCCVNEKPANEIPKSHPAHQNQLHYFTVALGKKWGPKFYFYTLSAAKFNGMHFMTTKELRKWRLVTKVIKK